MLVTLRIERLKTDLQASTNCNQLGSAAHGTTKHKASLVNYKFKAYKVTLRKRRISVSLTFIRPTAS